MKKAIDSNKIGKICRMAIFQESNEMAHPQTALEKLESELE